MDQIYFFNNDNLFEWTLLNAIMSFDGPINNKNTFQLK